MKKVFSSFILILCLLLMCIYFISKRNEKEILKENIYTVSTYNNLLTGDDLNIKLYSNNKKSLLRYLDKADIELKDKKDKKVSLEYKKHEESSFKIDNNTYYEFDLVCSLDITECEIEECFLDIGFDNKKYVFNIGYFSITDRPYNRISYDSLYGLFDSNYNNSLAGIVIDLSNDYSNLIINDIYLGSLLDSNMNEIKNVKSDKSTNIYDYHSSYNHNEKSKKTFESKDNSNTILIPIAYNKDIYVNSTYVVLDTNYGVFIVDTFIYSIEVGFENQKNLLKTGVINDL